MASSNIHLQKFTRDENEFIAMAAQDDTRGEKDSKESYSESFKKFADNTTAHGFAHITATTNWTVKLIWVIIMVACTAVLVFQIQPLIKRYLEKPTGTKISVISEKNLRFPVIVICNGNMIKKSQKQYLRNSTDFDIDYIEEGTDIFSTPVDIIDDFIEEEDANVLTKFGHQLEETVLQCGWRNIHDCKSLKYWQTVWNYNYGNCFVFNSGFETNGKEKPILNVSRPGPNSGLMASFHILRDEYDLATDTTGMRLFIGDQGELYSPYNHGVSLSTGFSYSISIHKKVIKRIDPFNNQSCIKHRTRYLPEGSFSQRVISKYTKEFCFDLCLADSMYKRCGCIDYWLPNYKDLPRCKRNFTSRNCLIGVVKLWAAGYLPCLQSCHSPCDQIKYEPKISMQRLFPSTGDAKLDLDILNNELKLAIYFEDFEYEFIENYQYYGLDILFGDIGGQLGLFNGYSILTLFEIIFFSSQLARISYYRCFFKKKRENQSEL